MEYIGTYRAATEHKIGSCCWIFMSCNDFEHLSK